MRILIVDDDVFSRTLLSATLRHLGHHPVTVTNGQEAIETYRKSHFPLVISGWVMPYMDGLELCRLIRAEGHQTYTYIILLTVMQATQSQLEGLSAGADDFITKPFNEDALCARILIGDRIVNMQNVNRVLAQLIQICSYCKKTRVDSNYRQSLDQFLPGQKDLHLSHGICPDCYEKTVRPELARLRQKRGATHGRASSHSAGG